MKIQQYGCPYSKWNWDKMCEVCELTDKPTDYAVMCDFGYDEECDIFKQSEEAKPGKAVKLWDIISS